MKVHSERSYLSKLPRRVIALAALSVCAQVAWAADPFKVRDIRVEGIQRTEAGTVFSYLPVQVGDTYTDDRGITAIKALYATGLFKDVRIEIEGDVLVILIEERPAIANVELNGFKEFEKDAVLKNLKDVGLGEGRIFDRSLIDRAEQELKRQYLGRGFYAINITTTITPIERNRVKVSFDVDEGDAARIKQIKFVGNKAFSDSELMSNIALSTPGWFTWYTKSDQYSKQKLTGDIETLKSFYLNRGYLEMQIESTQVSISTDKREIYITVNVTEGEKYTISDIKLEGEMFGREEELKSILLLKKGDTYSGDRLTETIKRISDRLGNFGYAFANVNANPDIDHDKNQVAFTILIDPGKRVYVRHINISGNTKTRDEVIRREFRTFEESWYDGDKIKKSRDRVDRLGYFKDVTIETPEVPGTNDQVDVNLAVTERPTGNISVGAGYSQYDKLTITGSIQQQNAFGSGDTIGLDVNTSRLNRTIAFSETKPYFTDDGVSRSYELYLRTTRPPLINTGDYNIRSTGGKISFGVPFTEYDTVFFGAGLDYTRVQTYTNVPGFNDSPQLYKAYAAEFGDGAVAKTKSFPLTAAWARDSRDSLMTPTRGALSRINLELAPAGSLRYYRATFEQQYYRPLWRSFTLALRGEFDYGAGLSGRDYPVFKNYYAGGIGTVRGYEAGTLGPLASNGDPLGGSSRLIMNSELQSGFPGSGSDKSLRWFAFLDGGETYAEHQKIQLSQLRYAAGLGISWISPVGPLKLSYAWPLNAKPTDQVKHFQFQLGTGF